MAKYKWSYVTVGSKLCQGKAEIAAVILCPSGASINNFIYDGVDTEGDKILTIESAVQTIAPFIPPEPIPIAKGIFIDVGINTTAMIIQWRELNE